MGNYVLAATPLPGHADPVIEVAAGLVQRGHRAKIVTGRLFRDRVQGVNAEFVPLPHAADIDYRDIDARFPERATIPPGPAQMLWGVRHLFADAIPAQLQALRDAMSGWPVDAIVADMMFLGTLPLLQGARAARPAIAHLGISSLALSAPEVAFFGAGLPPARTPMQRIRNSAINQFMQGSVFASLQAYVDGVLAACGVPRLPSFLNDAVVQLPDAYLQIGVSALEYPRSNLPAHLKFIGVPRGIAATGMPPNWWTEVCEARSAGRKVCLVTQGTVASADLGQLLKPAFAALASSDALVIATTSGADLRTYAASAPRNVRLARFIPYAMALPQVDLLITNGGFGGVMLALTHGVPVIVAGDSEEKPEIAARVAHAGVGIDLATGRPAPALIAAAVADIFGNPLYAQRAREVAALIGSIDSIGLIESILDSLGRAAAA